MASEASATDETRFPRRARAVTQLSQERWRQILEAATRLFKQKGFAATSMQDVSDEVGLLKGSLYYYVRSKEELLFEILRDLHEGGIEIVDSINFNSNDPLGELKTYLHRVTVYAGKHRERLAIFLRDFRFVSPAQQVKIIADRDMYEVAALHLIEEAKKLGQVDPSINSKVAAFSILGATSVTHEWYRPDGPVDIEIIGEQIAATMVNGLASSSIASAKPKKRAKNAKTVDKKPVQPRRRQTQARKTK